MKRNVLAVVIPALLAAGAANAAEVYNKDGNKLDLYGKVVGLHYFSKDSGNDGDQTYARLGFKGETQIADGITGYGRFEEQFYANRTEETEAKNGVQSAKTRLAYAGLNFSDAGSIDYGRNYGIAYDTLSYTDVLPEFGGDQAYTDNITGRTSGVATYRNKGFFGLVDGLDFGLQYQGKHEDSSSAGKQTGDGFGFSAQYTAPVGVGIVASYESADRTDDQQALGHGKKAEAWGTGLKYDANNIYLAAIYSEFRNLTYVNSVDTTFADKTQVFEAVAQYNFDFGLTPSLGYVTAKAKDDSNGKNDYITKYVSLGATYAFNKNASVYTEYDINLLKDDNAYGLSNDDVVAVGIVYQF